MTCSRANCASSACRHRRGVAERLVPRRREVRDERRRRGRVPGTRQACSTMPCSAAACAYCSSESPGMSNVKACRSGWWRAASARDRRGVRHHPTGRRRPGRRTRAGPARPGRARWRSHRVASSSADVLARRRWGPPAVDRSCRRGPHASERRGARHGCPTRSTGPTARSPAGASRRPSIRSGSFPPNPARPQRPGLRGERQQPVRRGGVVQRTLAEPVARQQQRPSRGRPTAPRANVPGRCARRSTPCPWWKREHDLAVRTASERVRRGAGPGCGGGRRSRRCRPRSSSRRDRRSGWCPPAGSMIDRRAVPSTASEWTATMPCRQGPDGAAP